VGRIAPSTNGSMADAAVRGDYGLARGNVDRVVLTWDQIDKDWGGLQKRHRMEVAEAVARYCVGHKMDEVATRLGFSRQWLSAQLDYAGIGVALGLGVSALTPKLAGSTNNVAKEIPNWIMLELQQPSARVPNMGPPAGKSGDKGVDHAMFRFASDIALTRLQRISASHVDLCNHGLITMRHRLQQGVSGPTPLSSASIAGHWKMYLRWCATFRSQGDLTG
jgi:hypothetical protein